MTAARGSKDMLADGGVRQKKKKAEMACTKWYAHTSMSRCRPKPNAPQSRNLISPHRFRVALRYYNSITLARGPPIRSDPAIPSIAIGHRASDPVPRNDRGAVHASRVTAQGT